MAFSQISSIESQIRKEASENREKTFHFECQSGCGKCCNSAPQMSIMDGMKLYEQFILTLSMTVVPEHSILAPSIKEIGQEIASEDGDISISVLYGPTLWHSAHKKCPILADDKSCSIYENRPLTCRHIPLNLFHQEKDQGRALSSMSEYYPGMTDD